jgi:hypothetical protein
MRRLLAMPVLAATLVLAAVGCGSDSEERNDYARAVNRAQADFASSFRELSRRITATSTPRQGRRTLQSFEEAVAEVVRDLKAIRAPDDVRPLHRRLTREIAAYGREIRRTEAAYETDAPQQILEAQTDLAGATTRISGRVNRTIDAINRALRG